MEVLVGIFEQQLNKVLFEKETNVIRDKGQLYKIGDKVDSFGNRNLYDTYNNKVGTVYPDDSYKLDSEED